MSDSRLPTVAFLAQSKIMSILLARYILCFSCRFYTLMSSENEFSEDDFVGASLVCSGRAPIELDHASAELGGPFECSPHALDDEVVSMAPHVSPSLEDGIEDDWEAVSIGVYIDPMAAAQASECEHAVVDSTADTNGPSIKHHRRDFLKREVRRKLQNNEELDVKALTGEPRLAALLLGAIMSILTSL